jgi:hypothetical protein
MAIEKYYTGESAWVVATNVRDADNVTITTIPSGGTFTAKLYDEEDTLLDTVVPVHVSSGTWRAAVMMPSTPGTVRIEWDANWTTSGKVMNGHWEDYALVIRRKSDS